VRPTAADIIPGPTIRLSGPSTEEEVRTALAAHLRDAVKLKPGCSLALEGMSYDQELLERTGHGTLYAAVLASGPGFFPVHGQATFPLERGAPPQRTPLALWVSNEPESISSAQFLLKGEVPPFASVRLFYHHLNTAGSPLVLALWAQSSDPEAALHLLGGGSKPQPSPMAAGKEAITRFLRARRLGEGFFVNVGAGRAVLAQQFDPGETLSGLYELTNSGPRPVRLILEARLPADWTSGPLEASTLAPLSRQSLYAPERQFSVNYRAGEDWGVVELGRQGELSVSPRVEYRGSYGVLHRIRFRAINNTSSNIELELACYAGGGKTVVVYQLDGSEPRATPVLRSYGEARLASVVLGPGQERTWEMVTVPVGGCFYPVSLILRPAP